MMYQYWCLYVLVMWRIPVPEISGGQGLEDEGCKIATTRRLGLGDLSSGLVFKVHIESSSHSSLPQVYIV